MGFLDRLLGRMPTEQQRQAAACDRRTPLRCTGLRGPAASDEERAVARYRYLLRTAPPEQLEALHAEAFATLTPEQRQQLLRELSTASPTRRAPRASRPTSRAPPPAPRCASRARCRTPSRAAPSAAARAWAACSPAR